MQITVSISPSVVTSKECSEISLISRDGLKSVLYIDFTELLQKVRIPPDNAQDFLLVATTIYALDKLVARSKALDHWTREFDVTIPVVNSEMWNGCASIINECLSFLSGDIWNFQFITRNSPLILRKYRKRRLRTRSQFIAGTTACLFSGGLDSLVGVIDWLELYPDKTLAIVGHHDPGIGGPLNDQRSLYSVIDKTYPDRLQPVFIGIGHKKRSAEITMRSRSLLFIALGIFVAEHLGEGTPLLIPENGTIALNVPLTPSRRGSCSTRTAHPFYLELLQIWLTGIGLHHSLKNPLIEKTKGEVVTYCLNQPLLKTVFRNSVSCAKRGHTRNWINKSANGCGRCMPCIYRRAALNVAGLDDEIYGVDVCRGEVDWTDPDSKAANDLRACLSFLHRNPSQIDIAKMLIANGYSSPLDVIKHAGTVKRAMDEIRKLITDKGISKLMRAAGLRGCLNCAN